MSAGLKERLFNTCSRAKSRSGVKVQGQRSKSKQKGPMPKGQRRGQSPGPDQRPEIKVQNKRVKAKVFEMGGHRPDSKVQKSRFTARGQGSNTRGQGFKHQRSEASGSNTRSQWSEVKV